MGPEGEGVVVEGVEVVVVESVRGDGGVLLEGGEVEAIIGVVVSAAAVVVVVVVTVGGGGGGDHERTST